MKRYLLLASVAGCLLNASNAWAASIDDNKHGATINVKAEVSQSAFIYSASDLDFGSYILSGNWMGFRDVATMDADGTISQTSAIIHPTTGTPGEVKISDPASGGFDYTITCLNSEVDPRESNNGCVSTDGNFRISSVTTGDSCSTEGDEYPYTSCFSIGATLEVGAEGIESLNEPMLRVTLSYY